LIVPLKEDSGAGRIRRRTPSGMDMTGSRIVVIAVLFLGAVAAGCGSGQAASTHVAPAHVVPAHVAKPAPRALQPRTGNPPAFVWLRPAPPPSTWPLARLSGRVAMAYPPSWRRIKSDTGTVSAAVVVARTGLITEYLNATPQQSTETLRNWASFRTAHNAEEGDGHERVLAAARDLRFRDGHGTCVIDRYQTVRARYQEIACLVKAPAGATVIVAAALASSWSRDAPALERAVSAFVA
jgi:hypothetical protein